VVDGRDYNKTIKTNNSGEFSFKINTSAEGVYRITLVFQKKGYDSRRITCLATRTYTEQDRRENIRSEAVKPAYSTLKSKLTGYAGRYMVYPLYVREVTETATGYLTFAGMSRTKSGVYKDVVAIRSTEQPIYAAGDKVTMYLKCLGTTYEVIGDDGTSAYPYFDLQWAE
jgi:hypothetical protein